MSALNKRRLRVRRVVDVPLHEVSGICLRRSQNGRLSLIAVGDRAAEIAWFSQPRNDKGRIEWHTSNSSKLDTRKPRRNLVLLEPAIAQRGRGQLS